MDELKFRNVDLQQLPNQLRHQTDGLSSSTLVVRRGQSFQIQVNFDGRPFDSRRDKLIFKVLLGPFSVQIPISVSEQTSPSQWSATLKQGVPNLNSPRAVSVLLFSPASASIGVYTLSLTIETRTSVKKTHSLGQFTLLCNPWSLADSVYLSSEDLRKEYVRSDIGVLFKGSANNYTGRPWSFDQYEKGILDICMKLFQLSPQYQADVKRDVLKFSDPIYISRVISAMVNCQDDKGVLMGNWSGDYKDGVNPSQWSGSADILQQWSKKQFNPVKYGQCWVFAAVMCTVMRALGIPTRVVTNFNSAHDTNGNMVIEEYYTEKGEKLSLSRDSIWNFHVWVECWMKRPDLGQAYDGWQVLDPTPQERSAGIYRCGPAAVKAILDQKVDAVYDVPFVFAEVNADVRTMITRNGKILESRTDTKRVGALICTKQPGSMQMQNITSEYKNERDSFSRESIAAREDHSTMKKEGITVSLSLLKAPVMGENISFSVKITNNEAVPKDLKKHVNAQNKEYNGNPITTFWEAHDDLKISPNESVTIKHDISFREYALKEVREDYLVNLAVVIEDVKSQKRELATEEFNITSPALIIQVANENSVIINTQQAATVMFTSPFNVPVSGELIVLGSGLLEEKVEMSVKLKPGETLKTPVQFIPKMTGPKMLHASLALINLPTILRGFKTINIQPA
ncbi:protein-glutamine gamma-glutamyltransferase 5-like [Myxocyprinus asiaticus]|uniref:protein-glutamine gamma-glutamyltransferase 5-like n=1 Tax=Myxocyprinus asiaticus TaxID=70543 RepID=UPI0022236C1B|nr:protein-glutamine gamma-glutamyltransferase 5-like [Myxocyprinus asiaticus]